MVKLFLAVLISIASNAILANPTFAQDEDAVAIQYGADKFAMPARDVRNANVTILGTDNDAYLNICLKPGPADLFDAFVQSHRGKVYRLSVGPQILGEVRFSGGLEGGCGVLGPFQTKLATQLQQLLLGKIAALPPKPPPPIGHCPEQEFIEICLRAFTDIDSLEALATEKNWQWHPGPRSATWKGGTLNLADRTLISVGETRFSDIIVQTCNNYGYLEGIKIPIAVCPTDFGQLNAIIGNPGKRQPNMITDGISQQWLQESGDWRMFIQATVFENGAHPGFIAEKIRYLRTP